MWTTLQTAEILENTSFQNVLQAIHVDFLATIGDIFENGFHFIVDQIDFFERHIFE